MPKHRGKGSLSTYTLLGLGPISKGKWADEGTPGDSFNKPLPHNVIRPINNSLVTRVQKKIAVTRHLECLDPRANPVATTSTVLDGRPRVEGVIGTMVDHVTHHTRIDPIERITGHNLALLEAILSQPGVRHRMEASVPHLLDIIHHLLIDNPILHHRGRVKTLRNIPRMTETPAQANAAQGGHRRNVLETKGTTRPLQNMLPGMEKDRAKEFLVPPETGIHRFGLAGITSSLRHMSMGGRSCPPQERLVLLGIHPAHIALLPLSANSRICCTCRCSRRMAVLECRRLTIRLRLVVLLDILLLVGVGRPARICSLERYIFPCHRFLVMVATAVATTVMAEDGDRLVHRFLHLPGRCQARLPVTSTLALIHSLVRVVRLPI